MHMDETGLTVAQAAASLREGRFSAEAYMEALLTRGEQQEALHAFISQPREALLRAARAADEARRRGEPLGPLHGVPLCVKDNIDTASLPTTGGTPALRRHQPRRTAPVVQALLDAGALLLGKTNLHELAYGITSLNGAFGAVLNPYAPERMAGGSSGGTAAAVSAGLAPAGLGTDTGGSVRIPAALCGICGLRPTVGRYSQQGVMLISSTRDTIGPMARTVEDLILLDGVITRTRLQEPPRSLAGLRLGVPRAPFYRELDPGVAAVVESQLALLREQGAVLIEADCSELEELAKTAGFPIVFHETVVELRRYLAEAGLEVTLEELIEQTGSPDVKVFLSELLGSGQVSEQAYQEALTRHRPLLRQAYERYFEAHGVQALVLPTTPLPARPLAEADTVWLGGQQVPTFMAYIRNTNPASVAGLPGLSVPAGLEASGLPVGLEFDGPPGSDRRLLAIGRAYEAVRPPLPAPRCSTVWEAP